MKDFFRAAHAFEDRLGPIKCRCTAATHKGQRSGALPPHRRYRGVHKIDTELGSRLADLRAVAASMVLASG